MVTGPMKFGAANDAGDDATTLVSATPHDVFKAENRDGGVGVHGRSFGPSGTGIYGLGGKQGVVGESTFAEERAGVVGIGRIGVDGRGSEVGVRGGGDEASPVETGVSASGTKWGVSAHATEGTGVEAHGPGPNGIGVRAEGESVGVEVVADGRQSTGITVDAQSTGITVEHRGTGISVKGGKNGIIIEGSAEEAVIAKGDVSVERTLTVGVAGPVNPFAQSVVHHSLLVRGGLDVKGQITKGGSSFLIDHPLDPENRYLRHDCVESPAPLNIYSGNTVTDDECHADVQLPRYFQELNEDVRYQLTVIGKLAHAVVAREVSENSFAIQSDQPGVKVSWQVTGTRKDPFALANRRPAEEDKSEEERGTYLHPDAYGKPSTTGTAQNLPSRE